MIRVALTTVGIKRITSILSSNEYKDKWLKRALYIREDKKSVYGEIAIGVADGDDINDWGWFKQEQFYILLDKEEIKKLIDKLEL